MSERKPDRRNSDTDGRISTLLDALPAVGRALRALRCTRELHDIRDTLMAAHVRADRAC